MLERFKEWLSIKVAWAMPKRLAMWAAYRVMAHASQGQWGNECPDQIDMMTMIGRWRVEE